MTAPRGRRARVVVVAALLSVLLRVAAGPGRRPGRAARPRVRAPGGGTAPQGGRARSASRRDRRPPRRSARARRSTSPPSTCARGSSATSGRGSPSVARALHVPAPRVQRSSSTQPFVWLKRQALPRELDAVLELGVPGVGHFDEPRRVYPARQLAAHVLGFVGTDAQGLAGLERRFDREIRGAVAAHRGGSRRARPRVPPHRDSSDAPHAGRARRAHARRRDPGGHRARARGGRRRGEGASAARRSCSIR